MSEKPTKNKINYQSPAIQKEGNLGFQKPRDPAYRVIVAHASAP